MSESDFIYETEWTNDFDGEKHPSLIVNLHICLRRYEH